jgi:pilus assembly protein FimV
LGGLAWYRRAQSKKKSADRQDAGSQWASSANTSFAVGGAQSVDTSEANVSIMPSSMYQESQLDLANELDPVAEAEVYLAYGKDVPAEEILKEGLQQTPKRVAIHLKLLAIWKDADADLKPVAARYLDTDRAQPLPAIA